MVIAVCSTVIFGAAAIVIDAGDIWQERRQLTVATDADGNSHHRQHRGRTGLHPGAYSRAWQGVGYGNSPSQCTITGSGRFRLFHAFGERSRQSWRSESARAPRLCHIATSPLSSRWRSSKGSGTNNLPSAKRPLICVRSRAPRR